jgi:hypothetical protein
VTPFYEHHSTENSEESTAASFADNMFGCKFVRAAEMLLASSAE